MAIFYLDRANAVSDSASATPYGFWSSAYNGGSGTQPTEGTAVTGATSNATGVISYVVVSSGTWAGNNASGTIYFKAQNGTFQTEQVNVTGGDHFHITANYGVVAWKTIKTGASAVRITAGDTIRIAKSPDPTLVGTATWTDNSATVTLDSAVTQTICNCETQWTASANVTATADATFYREGTKSAKISVASGFTTGLGAYFALPSTLDLSAYQQLSFSILIYTTYLPVNTMRIDLCTGADGTGAVDSFAVNDAYGGEQELGYSTTNWQAITLNKGSAMSSGINSIAVYFTADPGTNIFYLDNFIACKAPTSNDSLTLNSLISQNSLATGGTNAWQAIRSIDGTTVILDGANVTNEAFNKYVGTTASSVNTYKRETTKLKYNQAETVNDTGTAGNYITYSGGWNPATGEQDGETFYDGQIATTTGLYVASGFPYIAVERLSFVRCLYGLRITGSSGPTRYTATQISNCSSDGYINDSNSATIDPSLITVGHIVNNKSVTAGLNGVPHEGIVDVDNISGNGGTGMIAQGMRNLNVTLGKVRRNATYGVQLASVVTANGLWTIDDVSNNLNSGVNVSGNNNKLYINTTQSNTNYGVLLQSTAGNNTFFNTTISGNTSVGVQNQSYYKNYFHNCLFDQSTEVSTTTVNYTGSQVISTKHDQTAGSHKIFMEECVAKTQTDVRHTASGVAWQISPTNATKVSAYFPARLSIAKVAVGANAEVTVSAWLYRDNAGITGKLFMGGYQVAGQDTDLSATLTDTGSWQQLSFTFTPTEAGVVDIEVLAYGGTTYSVYVDDLEVSQA